jgi:hypothetical protein
LEIGDQLVGIGHNSTQNIRQLFQCVSEAEILPAGFYFDRLKGKMMTKRPSNLSVGLGLVLIVITTAGCMSLGAADTAQPPNTTQEIDSIAAAQSATPYEFSDPALPSRFSFENGHLNKTNDTVHTTMVYTADERTVRYTATQTPPTELVGKVISLNGTDAYLRVQLQENTTSISWENNNTRYRLRGDIDPQTAQNAAQQALSDQN